MNISAIRIAAGALSIPFLLSACSSARSNRPVYSTVEAGQILAERKGEVVEVRDVVITPPKPVEGAGRQIGRAAGAGVATGSPIGIARGIGEVFGGAVGGQFDGVPGEEIRIRMESGGVITVVQERGERPMMPGDRVRVQTPAALQSGGGSPITGQVQGPKTRVVLDSEYVASVALAR